MGILCWGMSWCCGFLLSSFSVAEYVTNFFDLSVHCTVQPMNNNIKGYPVLFIVQNWLEKLDKLAPNLRQLTPFSSSLSLSAIYVEGAWMFGLS